MPFANLKSTVWTRAKAASSVAPIWPINAWLITVTPNVENLVNIAGPATIQSLLLSPHIFFPRLSSSSLPDSRSFSFSPFSIPPLRYAFKSDVTKRKKTKKPQRRVWSDEVEVDLSRLAHLFLPSPAASGSTVNCDKQNVHVSKIKVS
ncbi:hypothetical protein AAC387_Pa02g4746 [Persea americana]